MLPRSVAVLIALALTAAELVNIFGQVFLGAGDTAIHVMYPAVLGALGLTVKRPADEVSAMAGGGPAAAEPPAPDPTPLNPRTRHRRGTP